MPSEWQEMRLGDFATLQRGYDLPDHKREDGPVPILGSFGITGRHSTARVKCRGVTIGRSGSSFGVVSYSPVDFWPLNTALYVKDFHGNSARFAYYFFKRFDFSSFNSGSAQPSLNRNVVHPVKIRIPGRDEQILIASFLGELDDRIDLLRKTNETLEAIARAIFKSWFVDFDPVRAKAEGREPEGMDASTAALFPSQFQDSQLGPIPEGWAVKTVSDLGDVVCGKTPSTIRREYYGEDISFITIPDMHGATFVVKTTKALSRVGADSQANKYIPPLSSCVSCIATPGLVALTSELSQTNQQINTVVPNKSYTPFFCFYSLKRLSEVIRLAGSGGSVFSNLSKGRFELLPLLLPNSQLARVFDLTVSR